MRVRHVSSLLHSRQASVLPRAGSAAARCRANTAVARPRFVHRASSHALHTPGSRFYSSVPSSITVSDEQTIFALSTAPGRAAIAIVRISGTHCLEIYRALCPGRPLPLPRRAALRSLHEPSGVIPSPTSVLDPSALVLFFPGPSTVTGQDVLELHIHGGPAITKAILQAIPKCCAPNTVRYAEAGEFTRRAFLNNRLDLTQVEALGDTLSATTEQQRRLAVRGSSNNSSLGQQYDSWARQLLYARGELEALIDFSEDQHFDESPRRLLDSVAAQVHDLLRLLMHHASNAMRGELLREGITCSLLGAPNVGKSSLLNRIVGREAAIVSPEAGTTRDVIEVSLDISGYLVRFGDTAGLRSALASSNVPIGLVEQEGVRRARDKARESDLVLAMLSFSAVADRRGELALEPQVMATVKELHDGGANIMVIVNKVDLKPDHISEPATTRQILEVLPGIDASMINYISCHADTHDTPRRSNDGIQDLLSALTAQFKAMTSPLDDIGADASLGLESLGATQRHRLLLQEASRQLKLFLDVVETNSDVPDDDVDVVLAAESLRAAAVALSKITGRGVGSGDVEAVLGVVFEKFCVGK